MGSSVSYITNRQTITEKSAKSVPKSLSFELKEPTSTSPLGSGTRPGISMTKPKYNYDTSGSIAREMKMSDGTIINKPTLAEIVKKMNNTVFIPNSDTTIEQEFKQTADYYNRFKVANPNLPLQKGFAHVFFVRPDCNILPDAYSSELRDELKSNETFQYTWRNSPKCVKELVRYNGSSHDFMFTLSNAAYGFSLQDEYINSDTYGKTYTGYEIAYGKHNIKSKTAGEFTVSFKDDRNLNIYQIHRLWVEYISAVFRGEISPKRNNIINKILDYTSACYYFLTAEDGETIIFWSKYYGVFPTNIPSSPYAWGGGNIVNNVQIDINYQYSFKKDFNPYTILEFNYNSKIANTNANYVPVYDPKLAHVGPTWVGSPFIELVKDVNEGKYLYKLRFRES